MSAAEILLDRQARAVTLRAADFDPNLKPELVAEILGVSVATLATWRCTGEVDLPWEKIGRAVRYRASVVEAFRQANTKTPAIAAAAAKSK